MPNYSCVTTKVHNAFLEGASTHGFSAGSYCRALERSAVIGVVHPLHSIFSVFPYDLLQLRSEFGHFHPALTRGETLFSLSPTSEMSAFIQPSRMSFGTYTKRSAPMVGLLYRLASAVKLIGNLVCATWILVAQSRKWSQAATLYIISSRCECKGDYLIFDDSCAMHFP